MFLFLVKAHKLNAWELLIAYLALIHTVFTIQFPPVYWFLLPYCVASLLKVMYKSTLLGTEVYTTSSTGVAYYSFSGILQLSSK